MDPSFFQRKEMQRLRRPPQLAWSAVCCGSSPSVVLLCHQVSWVCSEAGACCDDDNFHLCHRAGAVLSTILTLLGFRVYEEEGVCFDSWELILGSSLSLGVLKCSPHCSLQKESVAWLREGSRNEAGDPLACRCSVFSVTCLLSTYYVLGIVLMAFHAWSQRLSHQTSFGKQGQINKKMSWPAEWRDG